MNHYKSVEFLSIFRMSSPPAQTQSPPAETQSSPFWKLSGDGSVTAHSAIWCLVQVAQPYKDDKYFSCTFPFFEKAKNLFNVTGHHACTATPSKISIDILLPAAKAFGLKLA